MLSVISAEAGIAVVIGSERTAFLTVDEEPVFRATESLALPRLFQGYSDIEVRDGLSMDAVRTLLFQGWKADRLVRLSHIVADDQLSEGVRADAAAQLVRLRNARTTADLMTGRASPGTALSSERGVVLHRDWQSVPTSLPSTGWDSPGLTPARDVTPLTAEIVAAHVSNNSVAVSDLPMLIQYVHAALAGLGAATAEPEVKQEPAISIRSSVRPDYIVCLEDGKKLKMLKRHLMTHYQMTPDQYRAKWNLPADYPMVAPNYSEQRRELAKIVGLGIKRRRG